MGRNPEDVLLVAVSKTFPVQVLHSAIAAGTRDLGENRAQELQEKVATLGGAARWHFVGHLQTNKARLVVGVADLIHSVDRAELADVISRRAHSTGIVQDVLLEVNLSGEATKHGARASEITDLVRTLQELSGLHIRGLMTMAPYTEDAETSRPVFRQLAELGHELMSVAPEATGLSMGMSRDFEVAVEEGATIVRVGEAIFGSRKQ